MKRLIIVSFCVILIFTTLPYSNEFLLAQQNQCPGFMPSRLQVGTRARVTPGPSNNVRSTPSLSGPFVGQIPGSGEFLVLDGPECADETAWWRVDYDGLVGWTAEGSGTTYWLENIPSSQAREAPRGGGGVGGGGPAGTSNVLCSSGMVSDLSVGQYAEVIASDLVVAFTDPSNPQVIPKEPEEWIDDGNTVLILEGPECVNGLPAWRVQPPQPYRLGIEEMVYTDEPSIWVLEYVNIADLRSAYVIEPRVYQNFPPQRPLDDLREVTISQSGLVPIIDVEEQVSFMASGGGGTPLNDEFRSALYIGDQHSIYQSYPLGSEVTVSLFDPEGNLYYREIEIVQYDNAGENLGLVGIDLPSSIDAIRGIWIVEFQSGEDVKRIAYEFKAPQTPHILSYCDSSSSKLFLTGFAPHGTIHLALASVDAEYRDTVEQILEIWELYASPNGDLVVNIPFVIYSENVFILLDEHQQIPLASSSSSESHLLSSGRSLTASSFWCNAGAASLEDAARKKQSYGQVSYGNSFYSSDEDPQPFYAFEGERGDVVTIKVTTLDNSGFEDLEFSLTLLNTQGDILTERIETVDTDFGQRLASIESFELSYDGLYFIEVSTIVGLGNFAVIVEDQAIGQNSP